MSAYNRITSPPRRQHNINAARLAGVRGIAPLLLGVVPFALMYGVRAEQVGLSTAEALGMSLTVFAGASQLAVLELIPLDVPVGVIIATALVINARLLMYSAALAPRMGHLRFPIRAAYAFIVSDQAFALTTTRYPKPPTRATRRTQMAYFVGAAFPLFVVWQLFCAAGYLLGAQIPAALQLEFAIPLTFIALVVPALKTRPARVAAIVALVTVVLAGPLPYGLGLLVATFAGVVAGTLYDNHLEAARP